MPKDIESISAHFVAWLAYMARQVATVKIRERGRKLVGQPVRGDLEEHSLWNAGVKQAYAFMQDRDKCPTDALLVSRIQRRRAL